MRTTDFFKLILMTSALGLATSAAAVDWGLTGSINTGDFELDGDDTVSGDDEDLDYDYFQVGITLNTGSQASFFNYRGTLSYVTGDVEGSDGADFDGVAYDSSFGFAVARTATSRLWIGPAIDLQVVEIEFDDGFGGDVDVDGVGVTLGASVGVDLYPTVGGMFGVEAGVRFGELVLDADDDDDFDDDIDADLQTAFLRATWFFTGGK